VSMISWTLNHLGLRLIRSGHPAEAHAELANKTKAGRIDSPIFEKFSNVEELLKKLKDKGCTFGVCPPCAEYMGVEGSDKYDFIDEQGADWLMKNLPDATMVWL
jgi:predicted peroxiredoxin